MLTYLQKYNSLPGELRDKISTPAVMAEVEAMEKKYGVGLATLIMRVMVKDIAVEDLAEYFNFEHDLDRTRAEALARELTGRVFMRAAGHLGIRPSAGPAPAASSPLVARPATVAQKPIPAKEEKTGEKDRLDRWMESRKKDASERPPDFYFSAEDEEEIKKLSEKVSGFSVAEKMPEYNEGVAKKITADMNLRFYAEELDGRFSGILNSYWRGVRKAVDVKEALVKPRDKGGLDLRVELADEVLERLEKIKAAPGMAAALKPPARFRLPEDGAAGGEQKKIAVPGMRDIGYDFAKMTARPVASKEEKPAGEEKPRVAPPAEPKTALPAEHLTLDLKSAGGGKEDGPGFTAVKDNVEDAAKERPSPPEDKTEEKENDAVEAKSVLLNMADTRRAAGLYNRPAPAGKVKIEDVKYVPKLVGPIDELREMTLIDFRRLHDSPSLAAEKIKEKIGFLEEENYGKRLAGIKAWRQSPMNKLYLTIGQQSIIRQKPVDTVIQDLIESGKECLSKPEFMAVMELNKSLRF